MAEITIQTATPDRFDDIQHTFSGGGDGAGCQCLWWLLRAKDWDATTVDSRRDLFRAEVDAGPPPGLLAYIDGTPAAWVRVGPRTRQPRLAHTRNYAASPDPFDDPSVWAVSCFVVRREFRGQGLNRALLDAAVDFARDGGARVIEAYPIDVRVQKTSTNDLYHGALSTFEAAGFHEVARPKPHLSIVQRDLAG